MKLLLAIFIVCCFSVSAEAASKREICKNLREHFEDQSAAYKAAGNALLEFMDKYEGTQLEKEASAILAEISKGFKGLNEGVAEFTELCYE